MCCRSRRGSQRKRGREARGVAAAAPVGGGPTGGWCVVCGDCGCGSGGHGRPTGGWREACRAWPGFEATRRAKLVGMEAAVPVGGGRARAGLEIDHSEPKARVWRSRGRAAAHRRIEQPQKARRVLAPHGGLAGCVARRSGGVCRAKLAAWTASGRAGLAPHGGLVGWVARRSGGWGPRGRAGLAPHGDLAGCAIMLPRLAIAWARTPVLSPAACTTLEGSS